MSNKSTENLSLQKKLTTFIVVLFVIKLIAWFTTKSVAILTDTFEYTINVISGFMGLYSLKLSATPKDKNHPYGHGKIEFVSATIEAVLMIVSSIVIIYQAIIHIQQKQILHQIDIGIFLISLTAILNFIVGNYTINQGKKNNSLALVASGKHMLSDTYSTIGVVVGLIVIYFSKIVWIDGLIAIAISILIIFSGYKILRSSLAGIMDEADDDLLKKVVSLLQNKRQENWIDLHNLRIIKYGSTLHLDCHLTIPWYFNINEGHDVVKSFETIVNNEFEDSIELFVHTDGCLDFSCKLCTKQNCNFRKNAFEKRVDWNIENVLENHKHNV